MFEISVGKPFVISRFIFPLYRVMVSKYSLASISIVSFCTTPGMAGISLSCPSGYKIGPNTPNSVIILPIVMLCSITTSSNLTESIRNIFSLVVDCISSKLS